MGWQTMSGTDGTVQGGGEPSTVTRVQAHQMEAYTRSVGLAGAEAEQQEDTVGASPRLLNN